MLALNGFMLVLSAAIFTNRLPRDMVISYEEVRSRTSILEIILGRARHVRQSFVSSIAVPFQVKRLDFLASEQLNDTDVNVYESNVLILECSG